MKKNVFLLFIILLILSVSFPALAEGDYRTGNIELSFSPTNISGGDAPGFGGNLTEIIFKGEKRFYQGVWGGFNFTYGNGNVTFNNTTYSNARLNDWELYIKVPFNYQAEVEAERKNIPPPPESPLHFIFGYKSALLNSDDTNGNFTWEDGQGAGLGIGFEYPLESTYVYGSLSIYPRMQVKSLSNANTSAVYKDWVYRAGIKVPLKWQDNVYAGIGIRGETHKYANVSLSRIGVEALINWKL